jgi:hypothetical protein
MTFDKKRAEGFNSINWVTEEGQEVLDAELEQGILQKRSHRKQDMFMVLIVQKK